MGRFGRRGGAVVAGVAFAGSTFAGMSAGDWATSASAAPVDRNEAGKTRIVRQTIAQSSADRARERARAGDCAAAIDYFDQALRTSVDPTLHRDRGFCHEKLGDDFPAMDDYRFYLTAMPDAEDYEAVHERLVALQANHHGGDIAAAESAQTHAGTSAAYGEGVTISGNTGATADSAGEKADAPPSKKNDDAALTVGYRDEGEPRLAKNSLYLELFGPGLLYSVNYDRMIGEHFSLRLGFGYFGLSTSTSSGTGVTGASSGSVYVFFVPLMANYLVGSGNSKLELGAGATLVKSGGSFSFGGANQTSSDGSGTFSVLPDVYVGYRYAPKDGGFNFRVGGSVFANFNGSATFFPWPGISFGYGF